MKTREKPSELYRLRLAKKAKIASPQDIAKLAAPKTAQIAYNAMRIGPRLILRSAFELLRANMITRVLSAVVLLSFDTYSLTKKRISPKQYAINVSLALMLLVGGTAGWVLGGVAIGLILLESVALNILGGIVGATALGVGVAVLCERIIGIFIKDDTADMLEILSRTFEELSAQHGLDADAVLTARDNITVTPDVIKEMFAQGDRDAFARGFIEPFVQNM